MGLFQMKEAGHCLGGDGLGIDLVQQAFDNVAEFTGSVFGGVGLQESVIHNLRGIAENVQIFGDQETVASAS